MKHKRPQYSSHSPENHPKHKEHDLDRLRTTFAQIEDRNSCLHTLRKSYSAAALKNMPSSQSLDFRISNLNNQKPKAFQSLKDTLQLLQGKVKSAKEEMQTSNKGMKKQLKVVSILQEDQIDTTKPSDSSITLKNSFSKCHQIINNITKPSNFVPTYTNPYSPRRHSTYYVSQAIRAINEKNSIAMEHITSSIRIIKSFECYQIPTIPQLYSHKLNLPRKEFYRDKKTLVLDLDETLIHCVENEYADSDLKLNFEVEGTVVTVGINIRPYAISFLKNMAKNFQIIIFTASHHSYADVILDELDPDGEIFQHRLYRQHCFVMGNEWHVKDLRIINRDLYNMVLVDNAAYSYILQLENGIPIIPYYEGSDYQLPALENYLLSLKNISDVREANKKLFKLHHYSKFQNSEELIEQLYMNNFH